MQTLWQDIRFAVRTLKTNPGFAVVAVLILALGIGATTAVFSIVNAVLLRPLPYADPARLVAVSSLYQPGKANQRVSLIALTDIEQWRKESRTLESMGAFAYTVLPIRVGEQAYFPVTALMDPEFVPTLGNPLAMGTMFAPRTAEGLDNTIIITHHLWVEAFNRDPAVIGRALTVDGNPYTVRAVLREGFQFPRSDASYFTKDIEMLLPATAAPGFPPAARQWFGIARLKPDITLPQAEAEMRAIANGMAARDERYKDWSIRLTPLGEETARASRSPLLITLGISAVLLVIASTNVMNLLFSRGASRLHEMAIRKAIGGSTGRILRQLLTESICLTFVAGVFGVLIAGVAIDVLVAISPVHLPVTAQIGIDGTVLLFSFAVCALTALVAGLFPAVHVSFTSDDAMRSATGRTTMSRALGRTQQVLCVVQMGLGVGLLAAAGLLANSLWRLHSQDFGFGSDNILGFNLSVPSDHSLDERRRFYQSALDEIREIPGVVSAGWITFLPPENRAGVFMGLAIEGAALPPGVPPRVVNNLITSVDYFSTMSTPVLRGRDFRATDNLNGPPVIIINEALARKYFPNDDALGRRIGTAFDGGKPVREIIGIVKDSKDRGLAREPYPTVYIPFPQFALPYGSIVVKTQAPEFEVIAEIRQRLARLDPSVPLTDFQTIESRVYESLEEPRFYTMMAATCAFMAVLFVSLGLYGIVSFSVSRRTPEFGIRLAVGAQQSTIFRMVLAQGLRMAAAGVTLGLALSVLFTRVLTALLFQVRPMDPLTLGAAAGIVVVVTLLASYLPAYRASRVSPIVALRYE
jgi:putative ABC transport system permease protein